MSGHCHNQAAQSFDLALPTSFQTSFAVTGPGHSHSEAKWGSPDNNSHKLHCRTVSRHIKARHRRHSSTQRTNQQASSNKQVRHHSRFRASNSPGRSCCILILSLDSHGRCILRWLTLGGILRDIRSALRTGSCTRTRLLSTPPVLRTLRPVIGPVTPVIFGPRPVARPIIKRTNPVLLPQSKLTFFLYL